MIGAIGGAVDALQIASEGLYVAASPSLLDFDFKAARYERFGWSAPHHAARGARHALSFVRERGEVRTYINMMDGSVVEAGERFRSVRRTVPSRRDLHAASPR